MIQSLSGERQLAAGRKQTVTKAYIVAMRLHLIESVMVSLSDVDQQWFFSLQHNIFALLIAVYLWENVGIVSACLILALASYTRVYLKFVLTKMSSFQSKR